MGQSVAAEDMARLGQAAAALADRLGCSVADAVGRIGEAVRVAQPRQVPFVDVLRATVRLRARRNERLGTDVFRDPAWDMLLELVAAHHERRAVSVSALCFASGVPATTALRYVERMVTDGLLVRVGDFDDQRRILVEIAAERLPAVELLMREMLASAHQPAAPAVATEREVLAPPMAGPVL